MKKIIVLVSAVFATSVFAQTAPVATVKQEEIKPALAAPAKVVTPAKSKAKTASTTEAKASK